MISASANRDDQLARLLQCAQQFGFNWSTAALVLAAERRGIPYEQLSQSNPNLIRLGSGRDAKYVNGTLTSETRVAAIRLAADKSATNRILKERGFPVPNQLVVRTAQEAVCAAAGIGYPVVVKPLNSNHGNGASVELTEQEQVQRGFARAREYSDLVIVEEHVPGCDYRMLVINDRLVAAARRIPAHVISDGIHTIRELVERVDGDPRRSPGHGNYLTSIAIDGQAEDVLTQQGWTPDSVPAGGDIVQIYRTANLAKGATAIDCTSSVHPENVDMAIRAVQLIGLDVAGVDFITPDIAKPARDVGGAICEINASPGLRTHLASEGARQDVAGPIIDMLFPR